MLVPDEVRKCVVFLLYNDKNHGTVYAGTGFFIGVPTELLDFFYMVTAKHVIVSIQQKSVDNKVLIRMNDKQGGTKVVVTDASQWISHPTDSSVDVSILGFAPPPELLDYISIPITMITTEEIIRRESIGLGDEVFITGLFVNRAGKTRNIPIVRAGNIAAMPEEKIDTMAFASIDAYLIESRSIGGLSGSPVFVHLGWVRNVDGQIKFASSPIGIFYLLGLMHGHWDRDERADDNITEDIDGGKVNMGIAIVVPATKILEIINQPELVERRQAEMDVVKKKQLPVEDTSSQYSRELDTQNSDGITKEDFEEVLKKIARPLKKDDQEKKGT